MALPSYISGGTAAGTGCEKNIFVGPWVDGNGNVYTGSEDDDGTFQFIIRKSADGGDTWTEPVAKLANSTDCESVIGLQVGTEIHFMRQRSNGDGRYFRYRTSDHATNPDTWATSAIQNVGVPTTAPSNEACALMRRSNGDLVAFYRAEPSGADERIGWKKSTNSGTSWGTETIITISGKKLTQVQAVLGESDVCHIFIYNATDQNVLYYTLNSSDSLSGPTTVNDSTVVSMESGSVGDSSPMANHPIYIDDGGTERIYVAWKRTSDNKLVMAEIVDGTIGSDEVVSANTVRDSPPNMGSWQTVACITNDGTKVVVVYADINGDMHVAQRTGGSWGTEYDVGPDSVMQISANVFTHSAGNGGAKVVGFVYSVDSGTTDQDNVYYNEYALVAATPQKVYPIADGADENWVPSSGSDLYAMLDETSFSDSDYIESALSPSADRARVKLGIINPPPAGTRTIRWRPFKDLSSGLQHNAILRIYEGGGGTLGAGTLKETFTRNNIPGAGAAVTYEETITASITAYWDLWAEIETNEV